MPTLRELRDKNVLTLQELAEKCGVSKTIVWQWEQGTAMPRPAHIRKLAAVFGIDPAQMREIILAGLKELAAAS